MLDDDGLSIALQLGWTLRDAIAQRVAVRDKLESSWVTRLKNLKKRRVMSRFSADELFVMLRGAQRAVPAGIWEHRTSGVRYRVAPFNVLDATGVKPMVLYHQVDSTATCWVRPVQGFSRRFIKKG